MDNAGYDASFYDFTATAARQSAAEIVPLLLAETPEIESVVDVGCGTGSWLSIFSEHGVTDLLGLDGPHVDPTHLEIPADRFKACELEQPLHVGRAFDLALCLEVAEHLSEDRADSLVDELVHLAPLVLFSAAIPFQGGVGHINEQWPSYWAKKFRLHGYSALDFIRPKVWTNPRVAMWYAQNCLLYVSPTALRSNAALGETPESPSLDLVHPSLFLYHELGFTTPKAWVPFETRVANS